MELNDLYCCECDGEILDKDLGYGYNLIAETDELLCSVCQREMSADNLTDENIKNHIRALKINRLNESESE